MAKPEWGVKRTCQSCGVRFYDLRRSPIACPACKAVFTPDLPLRQKRASPMPQAAPVPAVVDLGPALPAEAEDEEEEEEVKEKEGDEEVVVQEAAGSEGAKPAKKEGGAKSEDLIEDASDLGEDEDDVSEVKEHIDEGEKERP